MFYFFFSLFFSRHCTLSFSIESKRKCLCSNVIHVKIDAVLAELRELRKSISPTQITNFLKKVSSMEESEENQKLACQLTVKQSLIQVQLV